MSNQQWEWIGVSVYESVRGAKKKKRKTTSHKLLDLLTFSQPYGEIVGIIGLDNTVKEIIEELILEKRIPSDGMIIGHGTEGELVSVKRLRKKNQTGYNFAKNYFFEKGFNRQLVMTYVNAVMKDSELFERVNEPIANYTVQEKAQFALSLSLQVPAEVMCIDECLTNVPLPFLLKTIEKLKELRDNKHSIWLTSPHIDKFGRYCDSLLWLEFGKLKKIGQSSEVLASYEQHMTQLQHKPLSEQQEYWGVSDSVEPERQTTEKQAKLTKPEKLTRAAIRPVSDRRLRQTNKPNQRLSIALLSCCAIIVLTTLGVGARSWYLKENEGKAETRGKKVLITQESMGTGYQGKEASKTSTSAFSNTGESKESVVGQSGTTHDSTSISTTSQIPQADFSHLVVSGDTLEQIAQLYGVTISELQAVNGLRDDMIQAGHTISLPQAAKQPRQGLPETSSSEEKPTPATTPPPGPEPVAPPAPTENRHVVASGDTLYQIAKKYGVDVMALQQANNLQTPDLQPGDTIRIPQ